MSKLYIPPFVCGIIFTVIAELAALAIIIGVNIRMIKGGDNNEEENKDKED